MTTDKESALCPAFLKSANEAIADALAKHSRPLIGMSAVDMVRVPPIESLRGPTPKDQNAFQSSGVLVKKMAQTVGDWRKQVPEDCQPVVLALLHGGVQINVTVLAEESFHALRIEGTMNGGPCLLLTHQASVQLLCYVEKV